MAKAAAECHCKNKPIFLFSTPLSTGTGISLHMVSIIGKHNNVDNPNGVILESPFNNMREEIKNHPFSTVRHIFFCLSIFSLLVLDI
jgi:hypothetical protein